MRIHATALAIVTMGALTACSGRKTEDVGGEVVSAASANLTDVDVSDYELDMDKMRKWLGAMDGLTAEANQDSSVAAAIASSGNETTSQSIAKLEGNAKVRGILDKAGLSPRDYVMTMTAFLRAAMADAAQNSNPAGLAPTGVNPKNVEFIRDHRAELAPMLQRAGLAT